jgi:hypothetical protein
MIPFKQIVLAGNSTFTISNPKTGNRFTFKVKQPKREEMKNLRFVKVLTGSDNESSYTFLGTIFPNGQYFHGRNSKIGTDAPSAKAFAFLWKFIDNVEKLPIEIRHSNNCCRCGRTLTVPSSIDQRIGPECAKHFGV